MTPTAPTTRGPARPSGRHPVSIGHLVMGLAFVGLVGVWALVQGDVVHGADIRWLLPVPWVLAGFAGLLASTLTARGRWAERQTGWVPPARTDDAYDAYAAYDAPAAPAADDDAAAGYDVPGADPIDATATGPIDPTATDTTTTEETR